MWQFEAPLTKLNDNPLWTLVFFIPENIVKGVEAERNDKRVICKIQDFTKHCALISDGKGSMFIMVNKQECKQLKIELGDSVLLTLEPDNSKYGMPIPEAFEAVMETDIEGEKYFESLTPGKKRTLLHLVGKIKNQETQINKSLVIMEHLKRLKGKIDFKILNQDFKRSQH